MVRQFVTDGPVGQGRSPVEDVERAGGRRLFHGTHSFLVAQLRDGETLAVVAFSGGHRAVLDVADRDDFAAFVAQESLYTGVSFWAVSTGAFA